MPRFQFSEQAVKDLVFKSIPRPRSIALIGQDKYQIDEFISLLTKKYFRDSGLASFNLDVFDNSKYQRFSNSVQMEIDASIAEQPISSEVRISIVDFKLAKIPSASNIPLSSIAIFINPSNPDDAELCFTVYNLYGRRLSSFTRSLIKDLPPLSEFFSNKEDILLLTSSLYSGDTQKYVQEMRKLQKLAMSFPNDFYDKAKYYILASLDSRTNSFWKIMRSANGSSSQVLDFIYKSIFVDYVLDPLMIFNLLSQHFFAIAFSAYSKSINRLFSVTDIDNNFVTSFLRENVIYDKVYKELVLKPECIISSHLAATKIGSWSRAIPSFCVELRRCPGPANCSAANCCSLAEETINHLGFSLVEIGQIVGVSKGYCPLFYKSVKEELDAYLVKDASKKLQPQWEFFITGNPLVFSEQDTQRQFLEGFDVTFHSGQRASAATMAMYPWGTSPIFPVGVRVLRPARTWSISQVNDGLDLFIQADIRLKTTAKSVVDIMAIFTTLVVFLVKGEIIREGLEDEN